MSSASNRNGSTAVIPQNSSSIERPSTPTSPTSSRYPTGYGPDDSLRERLLAQAGYNEAILATITKQVIEKQVALLQADETLFFAYQGQVGDQRTVPAHRVQLEAARALTHLLGVQAPPAKQTVTVIHQLDLPAWMQPDVIDATAATDVTPQES